MSILWIGATESHFLSKYKFYLHHLDWSNAKHICDTTIYLLIIYLSQLIFRIFIKKNIAAQLQDYFLECAETREWQWSAYVYNSYQVVSVVFVLPNFFMYDKRMTYRKREWICGSYTKRGIKCGSDLRIYSCVKPGTRAPILACASAVRSKVEAPLGFYHTRVTNYHQTFYRNA